MNETVNSIMNRRSVRSFTDQKIPRPELETIVDAARYAPSAMNRQLCRFTVVQDKAKINCLAEAIRQKLNRDSGYNFYKPDCLIIASTPEDNQHGIEDCACALENMFLAAHSLGIGSVWINQLKGICNEPEIRAVLDELKIPENHLVFGMAALGYPAAEILRPEKRNDVEWFL